MLTDFLGMGQRGRNPNPFALPPVYTTPGIGDDLPGATPMGQATGTRPGMFGNRRSAAIAQGQAPDAGAGFGQAPISLMALNAELERPEARAATGIGAMAPVPPAAKEGVNWIGVLADALAGAAGQPGQYAMSRRQDRQIQRQESLYQRQRADQMADWRTKEEWKAAHPDDQFTQFMVAGGIDPRSPQGQALYKQRAEGMAAPPLMAVDGFDAQGNPTKTFMPRPTFAPGPSKPAEPSVGMTRNGYRFKGGNPNDRSNWEPVGGASPVGGATFR